MPPKEREERAARFADPNSIPVAYSQAYVRVDRDAAGKETPVVVGGNAEYGPNLHLSSLATAATTGNASRYDLYISVAVVRQTCSGCYQWAIDNWVSWSGSSPTGLNCCNASEETFASAWAGGLYLWTDTKSGVYMPDAVGHVYSADIYRSDVSPNAGVGWSFHEWRQTCGMGCFVPLDWADGTSYIREDSWASRTDNVVNKYFHTFPVFSTSYALGYPGGVSVSISPTNDQWSIAAYAAFSH